MPIGSVTRGTTGTNRLRRVDRWIAHSRSFLRSAAPLVVDLGFVASPATTLELHQRLTRVRPGTRVVGIEIDPSRVALAAASAGPGVEFAVGGFEVPLAGDARPDVIRALNVLRQYGESEVVDQWRRMTGRLAAGGVLVEGTCNEVGRVASWVDVDADGPRSFTISLRVAGLEHPSIVAERLPKALIHRNVDGEPVHALLDALDRAWAMQAPLSTYGATQRWIGVAGQLRDSSGDARRSDLGKLDQREASSINGKRARSAGNKPDYRGRDRSAGARVRFRRRLAQASLQKGVALGAQGSHRRLIQPGIGDVRERTVGTAPGGHEGAIGRRTRPHLRGGTLQLDAARLRVTRHIRVLGERLHEFVEGAIDLLVHDAHCASSRTIPVRG